MKKKILSLLLMVVTLQAAPQMGKIQTLPSHANAHTQIGLLEREKSLRTQLEKEKDNDQLLYELASILIQQSYSTTKEKNAVKLLEAEKLLRKVILINPEKEKAYFYLGLALSKCIHCNSLDETIKKLLESEGFLSNFYQKNPDNTFGMVVYAQVLTRLGMLFPSLQDKEKLEKAEQVLQKIIVKDPFIEDGWAFSALGTVYAKQMTSLPSAEKGIKKQKAKKAFETALQIDPANKTAKQFLSKLDTL